MTYQFQAGDQVGWFHDQGHPGGVFHTYDGLKVAGPKDFPRKVHVFLPRDYEASQNHYPVIYMNDGDTAFFPGGVVYKSWYMADILSDLYARNQIRQVIVVAVCPLNRDREYTHAPVWDRPFGGLEGYATYLANPVKTFIDAQYRTLADPNNTMILGSSHGGLAAFYTATRYPDKFQLVGALSPSFWVGLDAVPIGLPFAQSLKSSALLKLARSTLQNSQKRLKIYLDWGLVRNGGFHNAFIEARATDRGREMQDLLLQAFGYRMNENLFVVEDPIGEHTEESWSRRMPNALKLFFGQ
jgi:predicted alpha/beta superfamily hydrolase